MSKSKSLFLGHLKRLGGRGSMREPLEMVTASRLQNMVEFRKKNTCFVTMLLFRNFEKVLLGLWALRSPTVGPSESQNPRDIILYYIMSISSFVYVCYEASAEVYSFYQFYNIS